MFSDPEKNIEQLALSQGDHVADFGSGTGLHAIELASRGFKIHGVDMSNEMISIASQRRESLKKTYKDNLKFSVSDLRNFRGENPRNIILSLFHVASYQVDDSDLVKFFTSASENLRPGGLFIFDYWFLPAVIKLQPENRVKNGENDTYLGQRTTNSKWISQDVVSVTFDITIKNKVSHEEINLQEIRNHF
jgi:predicted TPR repeat methyltransferase